MSEDHFVQNVVGSTYHPIFYLLLDLLAHLLERRLPVPLIGLLLHVSSATKPSVFSKELLMGRSGPLFRAFVEDVDVIVVIVIQAISGD